MGVVLVASVLGATLAFLSSRYVLPDWVQHRFGGRLGTLRGDGEEAGTAYLLMLRLVPVFPFFLINLGMGLTAMRLRTFRTSLCSAWCRALSCSPMPGRNWPRSKRQRTFCHRAPSCRWPCSGPYRSWCVCSAAALQRHPCNFWEGRCKLCRPPGLPVGLSLRRGVLCTRPTRRGLRRCGSPPPTPIDFPS